MSAALAVATRKREVRAPAVQHETAPDSHGESEAQEIGVPRWLQHRGASAAGDDGKPPRLQHKCAACAAGGAPCPACEEEERLQKKEQAGAGARDDRSLGRMHTMAHGGVASAHAPLPHFDRIQAAFGRHDLSDVKAEVGGPAGEANARMGSLGYTLGDRVGFRAEPDLRLAAHEAAHVVQQRGDVQLKDGIGRPGDGYEQQADAVADAVERGASAEPLLDRPPVANSVSPALAHKSAEPDEAPLQHRLMVNATRLFEPDLIVSPPPGAGAEASAEGPAEGEAPAETTEESGAMTEAEAGAPAEPPLEEGEGAGGGAGEVSGGGAMEAATSGGGLNVECYKEPAEEPDEESDDEKPDPPETKAEENIEPDLPRPDETDECPVGKAIESAAGAQAPSAPPEAAMSTAQPGAAAKQTAAAAATPAAAPEAAAAASGPGPASAMLDASIAQAESGRSDAVAAYTASSSSMSGLNARVAALAGGAHFLAGASEAQAESATRRAADARVADFFSHAVARLQESVALASDAIPDQLGATAEGIKATIGDAIEQQKDAVSARVNEARDRAYADADSARSQVYAEHEAYVAAVEEETSAAIDALTTAHQESLDSIDGTESGALDEINSLYQTSYDAHVALGPTYADLAVARGEEYAQAYGECMIFEADGSWKKDGFWAGYLTNRRAKAQQNAARETAAGYRKSLPKAANDQGALAMRGRRNDRCGIIAAAQQTRSSVDGLYDSLVSSLESGREQAIAQADTMRDGLLSSIESSLGSTLAALDVSEHDDRQSLDDTGYLQQVAVEQAAHAAAAAVQEQVAQAVGGVESALLAVRASLAQTRAPGPAEVDTIVAEAIATIDGSIDRLVKQTNLGVAAAEEQLAQAQDGALAALETDALASADRVAMASDAFSTQMSALAEGAASSFGQMREQYSAQTQATAAAGEENFLLAAAKLEEVCDTTLTNIDNALLQSEMGLEKDFQGKIAGLDDWDKGIPKQAQEAASKEQPAWKGVLAFVLIIIIVIVVALVIGPAVIGAVGAAAAALGASAGVAGVVGAVVGGAIVGAISSGAIQIVQNFAQGRDLSEGVGTAMLIGAATGALGGLAGAGLNAGLNALIGQGGRFVLSQGAQFAVRAAANIASDAVLNIGQQLVLTGDVNWGEFAQGMAMSLVLHGSRRVQAFQARVTAGSARATAGAIGRVAGTGPRGTAAAGRASAYAQEQTTQANRATEEARQPLSWTKPPAAPPAAAKPPTAPAEPEAAPAPARPTEPEVPAAPRPTEPDAAPAARPTEPEAPAATRPTEPEEGAARPAEEAEPTTSRAAEAETTPSKTGAPEDAMVGRSKSVALGGEEHHISIRRLGRRLLLFLCSNGCGEIILKARRMQARATEGTPEWQALETLAARAQAADEVLNSGKPQTEAEAIAAAEAELNALRDLMAAMEQDHPNLIDPNVPLTPEEPAPGARTGEPDESTPGARADEPEDLPDEGTLTPDEDPVVVPADEAELQPWEQGSRPKRYQAYKKRFEKNNPGKPAPTPEQWWREYGYQKYRKGQTRPIKDRPPPDPSKKLLTPEEWWEQFGRKPARNPHGGGGNPEDHGAVVLTLRAAAEQRYPSPRYRVTSNQEVPVPGGVRKPDVAVIDTETGQVVMIYEAARFTTTGTFEQYYEAPKIPDYNTLGIPFEFHPVGPNQPAGGVLRSATPPPVAQPPTAPPSGKPPGE